MTAKIKRSDLIALGITGDPTTIIQAHVRELNAWFAQERIVAAFKASTEKKPSAADFPDKTSPTGFNVDALAAALTKYENAILEAPTSFPMPISAPVIESAIHRDERDGQMTAWPDYEIVEDVVARSSEELSLRVRKGLLIDRVIEQEMLLISDIIPPGKQRIYLIRTSEIEASDRAMLDEYAAGETDKAALNAVLRDQETWLSARRSDEDARFLDEQRERMRKIVAIQRWAAEQMSEIEDLTDETIGDWTMTKFGDA